MCLCVEGGGRAERGEGWRLGAWDQRSQVAAAAVRYSPPKVFHGVKAVHRAQALAVSRHALLRGWVVKPERPPA